MGQRSQSVKPNLFGCNRGDGGSMKTSRDPHGGRKVAAVCVLRETRRVNIELFQLTIHYIYRSGEVTFEYILIDKPFPIRPPFQFYW